MMFNYLPRGYARAMRGLFAAVYLCVSAAGVAAIVWTPRTIEWALGQYTIWGWAVMAILAGLAGLWAMVHDNWRPERWATPLAVGSCAGYLIGVWSLTFLDVPSRATQGFWVTVAMLMLATRAVDVWAAARRDKVDRIAVRRERAKRLADGE